MRILRTQTIRRGLTLGVLVAGLACAQPSSAALVTVDPGTGTTTVFTQVGKNGSGNPGPVNLDGFVWTGSPEVVYGNVPYSLGVNGGWSVPAGTSFSWIATNNLTGSITVNLGGLFGLVGGFMNYSPGVGTDAMITALAADGVTVLESYDLVTLAAISTPLAINAGAFRGISRATNDIGFFRLSGNVIIAHTLEIGQPGAAVPEPSTLGLIGLGLLGLGAMRRRRRSN